MLNNNSLGGSLPLHGPYSKWKCLSGNSFIYLLSAAGPIYDDFEKWHNRIGSAHA